jgi:hypothetical protein
MEHDAQSAEIIAAADTHSTSPNGFGAATSPSLVPSPVIVVGAALIGGILLAGLIRRIRA